MMADIELLCWFRAVPQRAAQGRGEEEIQEHALLQARRGHTEWVRQGQSDLTHAYKRTVNKNKPNNPTCSWCCTRPSSMTSRCFSDLLESLRVLHQLRHHLEELARDWLDGKTWRQHRSTNEIVRQYIFLVE